MSEQTAYSTCRITKHGHGLFSEQPPALVGMMLSLLTLVLAFVSVMINFILIVPAVPPEKSQNNPKSCHLQCHLCLSSEVSHICLQAKNPARDLPVALFTSLGISTLLYLLMAAAITLMVPWQLIDTQAPFSAAFITLGLSWAAQLVSIGAVLAIGSVLMVCQAI